jgi:transcriptional regulator with XRE-family HTH domain
MQSLSQLLISKRERLGMTQEQVAIKLLANRSVVSRWENGKSIPDQRFIDGLSEVLKIDKQELVELRLATKSKSKSIYESRFDRICGIWEDWQLSFVAKRKIISSRVEIKFHNGSLRYNSNFVIDGIKFSIGGKCWLTGSCLSIDAKESPNGKSYGERAFMLYDLSSIGNGFIQGHAIGATSVTGFSPTHSPSILWRPPVDEPRLLEVNSQEKFEDLDAETKKILQTAGILCKF